MASAATVRVKVPGRFIQDCYDCECDVGDYERGYLTATPEQLAELVSRAKHYAHGGTDQSERGLVASAKALLAALEREQVAA
jgi:hypothetical protein